MRSDSQEVEPVALPESEAAAFLKKCARDCDAVLLLLELHLHLDPLQRRCGRGQLTVSASSFTAFLAALVSSREERVGGKIKVHLALHGELPHTVSQ